MVKTKKRLVCPICDKELKNARSVAGHMWFAHGKRAGEKQGLHDKIEKLKSEPKITDDIAEKIEGLYAFLHDIMGTLKDVIKTMSSLATRLGELESAPPGKSPGNPGKPGGPNPGPEDPNPEEVKPDEEKDKPDDEDKPILDLSHTLLDDDDEKKSEKTDDDNSWFL